ncbi:helix-turn-helix domain-containing protein [Salibacterium sp. K-3]
MNVVKTSILSMGVFILSLDYFQEEVSIQQLLEFSGMNATTFYKRFKEYTGKTPRKYIIHKKIKEAGRLLRCTSMSVSEVADEVGYDDSYYFSRLFKQVKGVPPQSFRAASPNAES